MGIGPITPNCGRGQCPEVLRSSAPSLGHLPSSATLRWLTTDCAPRSREEEEDKEGLGYVY